MKINDLINSYRDKFLGKDGGQSHFMEIIFAMLTALVISVFWDFYTIEPNEKMLKEVVIDFCFYLAMILAVLFIVRDKPIERLILGVFVLIIGILASVIDKPFDGLLVVAYAAIMSTFGLWLLQLSEIRWDGVGSWLRDKRK